MRFDFGFNGISWLFVGLFCCCLSGLLMLFGILVVGLLCLCCLGFVLCVELTWLLVVWFT